jgi:hypothetical protein
LGGGGRKKSWPAMRTGTRVKRAATYRHTDVLKEMLKDSHDVQMDPSVKRYDPSSLYFGRARKSEWKNDILHLEGEHLDETET